MMTSEGSQGVVKGNRQVGMVCTSNPPCWLLSKTHRRAEPSDPLVSTTSGQPSPFRSPAATKLNPSTGVLGLGIALFQATQTVIVMRAEGMHHSWLSLFTTLLLS